MEALTHDDPRRFRRDLLPVLMADEVRHNLMLGLLDTLINEPGVYPEYGLWSVRHEGVPIAAAMRTPPFKLVLGDLPDRESARVLAEHLADQPFPGSVGVLPGGEWFPEAFAEISGVETNVVMRQGIWALTAVREVPSPGGRPRPAGIADLPVVLRWMDEFNREALPEEEPDPSRLERMVRRRLTTDLPLLGFWLWEADGEAVSITGHGGETPTGIRIGPVYTPPERRGSGFATALVAAQAEWLLEQGRRSCFLYTDLSNPTSNAIYRRIGYEKHAESVEVAFSGPDPA